MADLGLPGPSFVAVPEPSGLLLGLIGVLAAAGVVRAVRLSISV
jgi:hypothetical protein